MAVPGRKSIITRGWLLSLLLLAGCAQNPATGGSMLTLLSGAQERDLGEQSAQQAIKSEGLYDPANPTTSYVTQLGQHIWRNTERGTEPLQMLMLDSGTFNAWATPGYINVYRGILPYLHSEAELAALLGHEAAHLTARHTAQSHAAGTIAQLAVLAGGIALAAASDDDLLARSALAAGSVGATLGMSAYGRGHEYEADDLAVRYLARSGYNPAAVLGLHQGMLAYGTWETQLGLALNNGDKPPESLLGSLTRSHPLGPDRLARAQTTLQKAEPLRGNAAPPNDPDGVKRYNSLINGLPVGPATEDGVARKQTILFPRQRLAWGLPAGMVCSFMGKPDLDDDERTKPDPIWQCAQPEAGYTFTLTFVRSQGGTSPDHALRKAFPRVAETQAIGFGQGTQVVTGSTGRKRIFTVALPATDRIAFLVVAYINPAAQQAHDASLLASLPPQVKLLTQAEANRVQPLQLAIRQSQGQSVTALASQLPVGALQEVWFRALNRLTDGSSLSAGQTYRTVVDPN